MINATRRSRALPLLGAIALTSIPVAGVFACNATGGTGTFTTGTTGSSAGGGGSAATGTGTTGTSGDGGSISVGVTSTGTGGSGGDDSCAQATAQAKLIPLKMFITIDQSGSMADNNKWDNVQKAFAGTAPLFNDGFFEDPNAGAIGVALRFWPDEYDFQNPNPPIACNDAVDFNCGPAVVAACETPEVDVGLLSDPMQVKKLVDTFQAHMPTGSTPTSAAIDGATKWAAKYMVAKNHTEQAVVVIVTDGDPTTCNTDITYIAGLADKAFQGAGVLTFAVGLDGSEPQIMNQIAQGGHTGQAFMIGNGNAAQDLLNAIKKIQAASVSCSFTMPVPPDPKDMIDLNQVFVNYTPGNGGMKQTFDQVANSALCGAAGGWYYDNPTMPTTINLCPATCTQVQADNMAKVEIFLGCIKIAPK
jgi:von Willebrand factor type A domain